MAPATRKKVVSGSTRRANSTERGTVADRWEAAGIKRKRDPRESDTRRPQNQHAPATDPKDSGRLATQASRNRTTTYHQGNRETFSGYWPPPSDIIDLTNDDDDDAVEGNCKRSKEAIQHRRITPSIKPELLNTGDTDIFATTSIKHIRPVAHDEPVGDNGIEQETSSMGPDIHSASVAALMGVTCDHLQASNKQSSPETGPTAKLGIQQGPAETNTPEQLVEGLLKRDLEKAKINVEKSKIRLKELEEKLKREKKNLTAYQTVVQYFTNLINGAKAGGGFIKSPRKKYTRHHAKLDDKTYSSVGKIATGPPASIRQPTRTLSTAPTSFITHNTQQSLENPHQSTTVDEDMLSETGSTTLHSGTQNYTVNPGMHSRNIDAAENESRMSTNYKTRQLLQGKCSLPKYRISWEEIKHSELRLIPRGPSLTRSDEIHKSVERQIRRITEGYGKCQCNKKGTKNGTDEGCTENCTNKESSILCDNKTCSIGREECQNRWLETWARKEGELSQHLEIRENPRFGKELIWNGPVEKDPERLIAEYRGQLISTNELMARREKQDGGSITEGHFNFEVKSLGGPEHLWLDSTYKGSIARFANHNCDPNCIVIQFLDSNGPRLFLQSTRRINPGDAITISYGLGVPPAYFRATVGLKSQDVPVCYCGRDGCQWKITSAVRDMEIWLNKVPGDWSKDRKPGEPVPRIMNLYLPGARHAINVFEGDCDPDNEEEILRIACGKVISHLQASLVKIMGGNGN
ncbi:SET domain protein [Fusarium sp. NRRL 25303]|nr:SET domain protein [Fusarium sp. NRRL 25303]